MVKRLVIFLCVGFICFGNVPISYAQDISEHLKPICSSVGLDAQIPIEIDIPGGIYSSCPNDGFGTSFLHFYKLIIESGTTLTFTIAPTGELDYDFISWKNPVSIYDLGPGDRGTLNNPFGLDTPTFPIGLSMTATDICEPTNSEGYPEPGFLQYYNVQAGDIVIICVSMYGPGASGYNLSFGGDAVLSCALEYDICDTNYDGLGDFDLNEMQADIEDFVYADEDFSVSFYNSYDNASAGGAAGLLQSSYSAPIGTNSAVIYGRVEDEFGTLDRVIDIHLTVFPTPQVSALESYAQCDANGDGFEIMDLSAIIPLVIGNQTGFECNFYLSQSAAEAGNNSFLTNSTNYFTAGATVYLRITNGDRCYTVEPIELIVTELDVLGTVADPNPLCDVDLDGFSTFNLNTAIADLILEPYYTVSFYESLADAETGTSNGEITDTENFEVAAGTTKTIFVRIGITGCFEVFDFTLTVEDTPELILDNSSLDVCAGGVVTLNANGNGNTVKWYNSASLQNVLYSGNSFQTPAVTQSTTYWAQAESANGCLSEPKSVTVELVQSTLEVGVSDDTLVCPGELVLRDVSFSGGVEPVEIAWSTGETSTQVEVQCDQTTVYTVNVEDGCGAKFTESTTVNVRDVRANFSTEIVNFFEVKFTNLSTPGDDLESFWEFGDGHTSTAFHVNHNYTDLIEYEALLTVRDEYGCRDTISKVIVPPTQVYVPNSFTPNGDGINDLFRVVSPDAVEIELAIYNRWGQEVHRSTGTDVFWNGSNQNDGYFVPNGVYVYKLVVHTNSLPEIIEKQGFVNMMR